MSPPSRGSSPVDVPEYSTQFEPGPDDNETLWNVLEIIKENKTRYLVKWEGVDPETGKPWDPSWVPKSDCTDGLILEWKVKKAKKDKAREKKRKRLGEMGKCLYIRNDSQLRLDHQMPMILRLVESLINKESRRATQVPQLHPTSHHHPLRVHRDCRRTPRVAKSAWLLNLSGTRSDDEKTTR